MNIIALIITTLAGISFLLGLVTDKITKNKKVLYCFSISLAFSVMLGLIFFDLLPELSENVSNYLLLDKIFIVFSSIGGGLLILKVLDIFVPHHHHDHHENKDNIEEHNANMYHIGLITSLALVMHNIIEGGSIYLNSIINIKTGLLIAIGVSLHNIPLGMEIFTTLDLSRKKLREKIIPIIVISLSTSLGAILVILLNINHNILFVTYLIGITIGMLSYLVIFELFKEIIQNIKNKYIVLGLMLGIIIIFISSII